MNFVGRQVFEFFKERPILTTINMSLALVFPIDDVLIPFLIGKTVTEVQNGGDWLKTLIILVCVIVGVQIMYAITVLHDAVLEPNLQNHVRHSITADLMEKYQDQKQELELGEVMSRFVRIPIATIGLYDDIKNYMVPYLLSFVITSVVIFSYDQIMGGLLFVSACLIFVVIVKSPYKCNTFASNVDDGLALIDEGTEDIMRNSHLVYTSNQLPFELKRLGKMEQHYSESYLKAMNCIVQQRLSGIGFLTLLLIGFVWRSYVGLKSKTLSIGGFVTIFAILVQWFGILGWLTSNIKHLVMDMSIISAYEKVVKKFVGNRVQHNYQPKQQPVLKGIYVDHISLYAKGRQVPIIKDFSMHVQHGERVAIIGEIGVGKSTLLKLLVGLKRPDSGHIYYDGVDLSTMNNDELRSMVGYVQQNPLLLNRSIYENLTYGLKNVNTDDIDILLNKLGLADVFKNLKDGLKSQVSVNLSGGQRQIIQCIRVMLLNPKVLLLDEITSSIDSNTKDKLMRLLNEMFKDKTVILVTHDKELLKIATRIVVMKSDQKS